VAELKAIRVFLLATMLAVPAGLLAAGNPGIQQSRVEIETRIPQERFDDSGIYREGIDALVARRFADARKSFVPILLRSPHDATAYYLAGLAHVGLDDQKGARRLFEQAIRFDGGLIFARRELALTSVRLGDRSRAEAELAILARREARCRARCAKATEIRAAIEAVRAALAAPPAAPVEAGSLLADESGRWTAGLSPAS
jgi:tetratricopeptide (TPR) repeat protein